MTIVWLDSLARWLHFWRVDIRRVGVLASLPATISQGLSNHTIHDIFNAKSMRRQTRREGGRMEENMQHNNYMWTLNITHSRMVQPSFFVHVTMALHYTSITSCFSELWHNQVESAYLTNSFFFSGLMVKCYSIDETAVVVVDTLPNCTFISFLSGY